MKAWHLKPLGSLLLVAGLVGTGPAGSTEPEFVKIADGFTPVPGGSGFFGEFDGEIGANGQVVFSGSALGSFETGLFSGDGGTVTRLIDGVRLLPNSLQPVTDSGPLFPGGGRLLGVLSAEVPVGLVPTFLNGLYEFQGETFRPVVDFTMPRPGGGLFDSIDNYFPVDVSAARAAFVATSRISFVNSLFLETAGSIEFIADTSTIIPGKNTPFIGFQEIAIEDDAVFFGGITEQEFITVIGGSFPLAPTVGLYRHHSSSLSRLVDDTTPFPNSQTTFKSISSIATERGTVSFIGQSMPRENESPCCLNGVYSHDGTDLSVVVDHTTILPNGTGTVTDLRGLAGSDGDLIFAATGSDGEEGIYRHDGSSLQVLADLTTPIPEGTGAFTRFNVFDQISPPNIYVQGGLTVFLAMGTNGQKGVYADLRGRLIKVAALDDELNGALVEELNLLGSDIQNYSFLLSVNPSPSFPSTWYRVDLGTELVSAVLPGSRTARVGEPVTVFAAIVNGGPRRAVGCRIVGPADLPAEVTFVASDPADNQPIGAVNALVDIPAGGAQNFLVTITPAQAFSPRSIAFNFDCANADAADQIAALNGLALSSSATPAPDIVAVAATLGNDGSVIIPGSGGQGVFAVSTINLGLGDTITVVADGGDQALPINLAICETDPASGVCLGPVVDATIGVTLAIASNETPTFGIFVSSPQAIAFVPAANRVFVRFLDSDGALRGVTSVALRSQ